jgi:DNA-binding GntR family transcriptional regulator
MADVTQSDVEPRKLRDQAYVSFIQRLMARELKPGQFISQRELVEITGLPLGAIRELIPRLEAEGLIKTVPQRGMHIAHADIELIRNAFQFRLFLEREATALFTAAASADLIARIRAEHEDILTRYRTQGVDATLLADADATDWRLHETIIDHLNNDIISNAFRVNQVKVSLIRRDATRIDPDIVEQVMLDHMKIIVAIEARDPAAAAAAMSDHIGNARTRALKL